MLLLNSRTTVRIFLYGLIQLTFCISLFSQSFTIPVFPDTQGEIEENTEMFFSQIRWIKENREELNIPIVLHVGDVVDIDNYHQWDIASEGFDILDEAHIPYAIAVGNHDTRLVGRYDRRARAGNRNANLRITDKFNSYFPVHRFKLQRGRFEENKSDNAYYTFRAGDLNWLVLTLEHSPRRSAVNWAEGVIEDYPDHNVIILTHYFLRSGGIIGPSNQGYGDLSPQELNDLLIEDHPNILMVISGHTTASAYRVGEGKSGNKIYQILQDYQTAKYNFGDGLLRLLRIDPAAGEISAEMYSPYREEVKRDSSSFMFSEVEFIRFPVKEE